MSIAILGAGAFGTALAVVLGRAGRNVTLWGRGPLPTGRAVELPRLPGVELPHSVTVTNRISDVAGSQTVLLAMPAQALRGFLTEHGAALQARAMVACCKGLDLKTLAGPVATIAAARPDVAAAILTGPSFAGDIARGLPTALTLACADEAAGKALQEALSTPTLRLYRTTDTLGAELGGALKNVVAIAAGACIGAGFGESARAALMTRGFAEMTRVAQALGARNETLHGLSGFGDLTLTCTSAQSRNYRFGLALGEGLAFASGQTVEGAATAAAIATLAKQRGLDLPIHGIVAPLVAGQITAAQAMQLLLARPLKEE
ncbi:MAG: NAD(P)H-dependent glycerol-3-phosphate dehydrogenase [Limimaricola sp.]|uniref:NAD(P)H-dependent glycerol-3-phosphate dehydrogenase n=1 Tax=Limimaricola sp. TaxID=2211665 RepID=UPI001DA6F890|nr:NAD(P)H-dependent glycerol-3-phosphate dehydrogenase [Limimaricola sp.]MBI1417249.1 NAD(P)H-dependent glycerol-3-phosphate dehydrogenase [Limimaricola sp.]